MFEKEKLLMPEFPTTYHLPLEPNASSGDKIATANDMLAFLGQPIYIEEKIDGSNCGISVINGQPLVRNRKHILRKNYDLTSSHA